MYFYTALTVPLLLFNLHTTEAQSTLCTSSNAISFESLIEASNSGGGSGSSGSSGGSSSNTSLDSSYINPSLVNGVSEGLRGIGESVKNASSKRLKKRELVTCTAAETCMSLVNEPFCVNVLTGDYRVDGESGNLVTGDFTLEDGQTGNIYDGTGPTPSSAGAISTSSGTIRASTSVAGSGASTLYDSWGLVSGAMTIFLGMLLI